MISVVMPVYNGEKYIKDAIKSILVQTYSKFEFLIIDDGSTDRTKEMIQSFNDERIRYYKLSHIGLPAALNFGLRKAKYNLIARMDSDDVSMPKRFEMQVDFLIQNPNYGIVGTNFYFLNQLTGEKRKIVLLKKDFDIKEQLPRKCSFAHPTIMFRKKIILSVGGYSENEIVEDWDLYLKLLDKTKFYNIQTELVVVRQHSNNISSADYNPRFKIAEEEYALRYYTNKIKEEKISERELAKANFDIGYFYYLRDDQKFQIFFKTAFLKNKTTFQYFYFFIIGCYFYPIIVFLRKFGLAKLLLPLKKIDRKNIFFRGDF